PPPEAVVAEARPEPRFETPSAPSVEVADQPQTSIAAAAVAPREAPPAKPPAGPGRVVPPTLRLRIEQQRPTTPTPPLATTPGPRVVPRPAAPRVERPAIPAAARPAAAGTPAAQGGAAAARPAPPSARP